MKQLLSYVRQNNHRPPLFVARTVRILELRLQLVSEYKLKIVSVNEQKFPSWNFVTLIKVERFTYR